MSRGLVKVTGEDDLFYDSIEKVYRYRMHCPRCGRYSGCRCFQTLEAVDDALFHNPPSMHCSCRCYVNDTDDAAEYAEEMHITIKPTMEEWNAQKIVKAMIEDIDDYEDLGGEACEI